MDEKMWKKRYRVLVRGVTFADVDNFTDGIIKYFDDLTEAINYAKSQSYSHADRLQDVIVIDLKEEAMVYFAYF